MAMGTDPAANGEPGIDVPEPVEISMENADIEDEPEFARYKNLLEGSTTIDRTLLPVSFVIVAVGVRAPVWPSMPNTDTVSAALATNRKLANVRTVRGIEGPLPPQAKRMPNERTSRIGLNTRETNSAIGLQGTVNYLIIALL